METTTVPGKGSGAMKLMVATCEEELTAPIEGKVTGTIPTWLRGSLYRVGPGALKVGDTHYNHLFDGMAFIHRFTISEGKVTYYGRFLNSDTYKKNIAANRIVVSEFGTSAYPDPCRTAYQRFMSYFKVFEALDTDNCLVSIIPYGDKLYAMSEIKYFREVDPATLDSPLKVDISKYVAVQHATAHPHIEEDGSLLNVASSYSSGARYHIVKFPPPKTDENGKTDTCFEEMKIVATIPSSWKLNPGYYHSFGITENYYIFLEQPLVVSVSSLFKAFFNNTNFSQSLKWRPERKTRFFVVEKATGRVLPTKYVASRTFFCFHHINAYEENGHLVVDVTAHEDDRMIQGLTVDALNTMTEEEFVLCYASKPWRFVLPLQETAELDIELVKLSNTKCRARRQPDGTIVCDHEILADVVAELNRINYKYNGKKYRYNYASSLVDGNKLNTQIVKIDADTHTFRSWQWEGCYVSEPVFVASPDAEEEDDGILLVTGMKRDNPKAISFVILNAQNLSEVCRTDFQSVGAITTDFHGTFHAS